MLDNTWKRSRRTCRNLLEERLGTTTLFTFLLPCRHFCSLEISFTNISFLPQELGLNYAILLFFLCCSKQQNPSFSFLPVNLKNQFLLCSQWDWNSPTQCSLKERYAEVRVIPFWRVDVSSCLPGERCYNFSLPLLVYQNAAINIQMSCLIPCELQWVNNHSSFSEKSSWEEIHQ